MRVFWTDEAGQSRYWLGVAMRVTSLSRMRTPVICLLVSAVPVHLLPASSVGNDPYLWLEDVSGERALAWARDQNAITQRELEASSDFNAIHERLLAIYDSNARIPCLNKRGMHYYNFWRDARHVRGLWRRTTLAEYRKPSPAWETVLDLDALAAEEKENWIWKNVQVRFPDYKRALISLSRGGGDAIVVREFDLTTKTFVKDGFVLPEAKSDVAWLGPDSIFVGSDFGPGSLTDSGYPRIIKEWKRGTPLAQASVVFEGQKTDVGVQGLVSDEPGFQREFVRRWLTFYTIEKFLRVDGKLTKLDLPIDSEFDTFREHLLVTLRTAWPVGGKTYPSGALIAIAWDKFLAGDREFAVLFQPSARVALAGSGSSRHHVIVNELDNVRNRLYVHTPKPDGTWARERLPASEFGSVSATPVEPQSDDFFLTVADFLTPTRYFLGTLGRSERELLKQLPAFFKADGLEVSQHEATSTDGTRVPYFQIARKGLKLDGSTATLLYGYGGFEVSMIPSYSAGIGAAWLERGGVYVLANIRGGGEFGPAWHQAALKENRQRAYDDFAAIAENLIARKVTSPRHLGIMGRSNGGLLVGAMFTQRPELFAAVVCQVPLLDMRRYGQLLAGASWMGEYGNPDVPEERAYLSRYSPYQDVKEGVKYPRVLFMTSTRDDRVHPGHARKMVAKMEAQRHDVLYYENIEGGHSGAANNKQRAFMDTLRSRSCSSS